MISDKKVLINEWEIDKNEIRSKKFCLGGDNFRIQSNGKDIITDFNGILKLQNNVIQLDGKVEIKSSDHIFGDQISFCNKDKEFAEFKKDSIKLSANILNLNCNELLFRGFTFKNKEINNDEILFNKIFKITNKIEYFGNVFDFKTSDIIAKNLIIGENKINQKEFFLNNDFTLIETQDLIINTSKCKINLPNLTLEENKISVRAKEILCEETSFTFNYANCMLNIRENIEISNYNVKLHGGEVFMDSLSVVCKNSMAKHEDSSIYLTRSKMELEGGEIKMSNNEVKMERVDININGKLELNGFITVNENAITFGNRKIILNNSDFYYHLSDKNFVRLMDDVFLLSGINLAINKAGLFSDSSDFSFKNSTIAIDDKTEVRIGDRIQLRNDNIKMNNVFITLEDTKLMMGDLKLILTENQAEMNNYSLELKETAFSIKNKKAELIVGGEELAVTNMKVSLIGDININNGIFMKNASFIIFETEINLENSPIKVGQNLKITKNLFSINQYDSVIENGNMVINNNSLKMNKADIEHSNGEINFKNSKINYFFEGVNKFGIEGSTVRLNNLTFLGNDLKIKLNNNFLIGDNKFINSGYEWHLKDVKIDYQDGKIALNPTFGKIKSYKIVLEESCLAYKDNMTTILLEKDTFYSSGLQYKLKDNNFEWLDKTGNQIIHLNQNNLVLNRATILSKSCIINNDKCEMKMQACELGINGGNIVMEDYRILDGNKSFIIKPNNWEFNSINFAVNKSTYKYNGTNIEMVFGQEKNKNMEVEYVRSKFTWNDEKNKTLLFLGDKSAQFSFPVVEFNGTDLNFKNKNGETVTTITDTGIKIENTSLNCINSRLLVEKNGFPIFTVNGDEVSIKNAPLKMQDSFLNYIYERKNAQLLLKNDILLTNYIDFEVKNGQFNWNQGKLVMVGNQFKVNELNVEFMNCPLTVKTGKSKIDFVEDRVEIEDYNILVKNLKNDFLLIGKNVVKVDNGSVVLKGSRLYNECFTLESNLIRINQAQQKIKQNDIFYEDSLLDFDGNSRLKMGEWEIREENDGLKISGGRTVFGIRNNDGKLLEITRDGQKITFGGIERGGGDLLMECGNYRVIKKDEDIFCDCAGRIFTKISNVEMPSEVIREINGEKYLDQIALNIMLLEKIAKLENQGRKTI